MIKIVRYRKKYLTISYTVQEDPTPGSFGDYILLKNELWKNDKRWTNMESQAVFNLNYLKKMREKHTNLHCAYCNKQNLVVYEFFDKPNRNNMATTDHILPVRDYPHLARDYDNLTVACADCNVNKGTLIKPIIYPYN